MLNKIFWGLKIYVTTVLCFVKNNSTYKLKKGTSSEVPFSNYFI
jgi:hypothetical protein